MHTPCWRSQATSQLKLADLDGLRHLGRGGCRFGLRTVALGCCHLQQHPSAFTRLLSKVMRRHCWLACALALQSMMSMSSDGRPCIMRQALTDLRFALCFCPMVRSQTFQSATDVDGRHCSGPHTRTTSGAYWHSWKPVRIPAAEELRRTARLPWPSRRLMVKLRLLKFCSGLEQTPSRSFVAFDRTSHERLRRPCWSCANSMAMDMGPVGKLLQILKGGCARGRGIDGESSS
mmetsp:Transcript_1718/g.3001  ORF Transcript_1718/g.3001 Transcript_1718/m.3001 type:complete len:233 (-) Transcript_1718:119-817(-)